MPEVDRLMGLVGNVAFKAPCKIATTASLGANMAGLAVIDGVQLIAGDRVLRKNEAAAALNGIWNADTGIWNRAPDMDGTYDVIQGTMVFVTQGGTNSNQVFAVTTPDPITIGTTDIAWAVGLFSGLGNTSFLQSGASAIPRAAQSKMRDIVSVSDYGILPNDVPAATANTTKMRAMTATVANGGDADFQMRSTIWFPPVSGGATWNFNGALPMRDGIRLDLGGGTLKVVGSNVAAWDNNGFLYTRRDFVCENGYIEMDFVSTLANRGNVIKLVSRPRDSDQGVSQYFLNNAEEDQDPTGFPLTAMEHRPGNIELRKLRIKSNNPLAAVIQMIGGFQGITMENIWIDGQDLANNAIDYEFGNADYGGQPAPYSSPISHSVTAGAFIVGYRYKIELVGTTDFTLIGATANTIGLEFVATGAGAGTGVGSHYWKSSHGANLHMLNMHIKNFTGAATDGTAIGIRGAYNVTIDGLYCNRIKNVLSVGTGEAAYAYPGDADLGSRFNHFYRNIVAQNVTASGISIAGGQESLSGYLAPLAVQNQANVEALTHDQINALVENFVLIGAPGNIGNGLALSGGTITLRNGTAKAFAGGAFNSGTRDLVMENVSVLDNTAYGMRNLVGDPYVAGWTDRTLRIIGGTWAGNVGYAVLMETGQCDTLIQGVKFGYNNRATGKFTVTGGTANPGVNKLTSLTVNGVEILNGPGTDIDHTGDNATTADAIAASILAYAGTSGYSAKATSGVVLIRAVAGTGTAPNGYVVVPTVAGNMTVGSIRNMSGGKLETAQVGSVRVTSGIKNIHIDKCNTLACAAGGPGAYSHQDSTDNNCTITNCHGDVSFDRGWRVDDETITRNISVTYFTVAQDIGTKCSQPGGGRAITISTGSFTGTIAAGPPTKISMDPQVSPTDRASTYPATARSFSYFAADSAVAAGAYVASEGVLETNGSISLYYGPNRAGWTAGATFATRGFSVTYDSY